MERPSEMNVYMNLMDPLSDLMKKTSSKLPKGFPPLDELMHGFKDFMQKVKVYMDDQRKEVINNIESKEEEVRKMKSAIQFLEDLQAALKLPEEERRKTIESVIAKFKKVNPAIRYTAEDKDEQLKENTRKLEKDLAFQKDEMETSSELIDSYANLMVPLSELMKKTTSSLPDGFPPLDEMMQMLKDFIQKTKVYIDDKKEDMAEAIEIKEEKLRKMKMLIQILEEQQAEL
ncbi:uncharacterized protein V6R79_000770 [Siganus canaliculatus]